MIYFCETICKIFSRNILCHLFWKIWHKFFWCHLFWIRWNLFWKILDDFREIFCDILLLRLIFHETFCEIFSWIFHTFHTCHIFSIGFNNSTYFTIVHFQVIQVHSTVTNATVRNPPRPAAMPRHWHSPGCQWQAPSEAPGGTGRAGTSIIIGSWWCQYAWHWVRVTPRPWQRELSRLRQWPSRHRGDDDDRAGRSTVTGRNQAGTEQAQAMTKPSPATAGSGSLLRVCRVHFFQKGVWKMVGAAYPLQH